MAVELPVAVEPSSGTSPSRAATISRLVIAIVLTCTLLPYAWGFTLITTLMTNFTQPPNWLYVGEIVIAVLAVWALTWNLSTRFSTTFNRRLAITLVFAWIAVNGTVAFLSAGDRLPRLVAVAGYIPATLWLLWLAWIGYSRTRWLPRIAVLVLLFAGVGIFVTLYRIEDLTGDNRVNFVFRWQESNAPQFDAAIPTAVAGAQADVVQTASPGDSWQFFGPERTGAVTAVALDPDWSTHSPKELWRHAVGAGWSSFATFGDFAITQEQRGAQECVVCYDMKTGAQVWMHADDASYDNSLGGPGPRATPTIFDGRVWSVGGTGVFNCLRLSDGNVLWSKNILADNEAENQFHGVCCSPLIVDNTVVVCPTGSNAICLAAYDLSSGERKWTAKHSRTAYSSPVLEELNGVRQILLFTTEDIVAHDATTGAFLWDSPLANNEGVNCSQPIAHANEPNDILVSTGYGGGSKLIRVAKADDAWLPKDVWTSRDMQTKFTSAVLFDGFVYGLHNGILQCIDVKTGDEQWKRGRYGHGQILRSGNLLIVQEEAGRVVLVELSPKKLIERGKLAALSSKTWNQPVLAGNLLLVRNDREAVCYELATLPAKDETPLTTASSTSFATGTPGRAPRERIVAN